MILSIIVLSYNTKDLTLNCLNSIIDQYKEQLKKEEFEIVVVDNNSTDDSVLSIKKKALNNKNINLIENKENTGFSKGCNAGTKVARGKYLLFLNSDTEITDKGLLGMTDYLEKNPKVGILGGKLKNKDGSIQRSYGNFFNLWNTFVWLFMGERLSFYKNSSKEKIVDWVSGGLMMIRSDLFKKLSGFDENFFMYIEDMELCYRAKKLGWLSYFYPGINIIHNHQGSSNRTYAILSIYKGLLYFYKKHKSFWEYFLLKSMLKKKALFGISLGYLTNNNYLKKTYLSALKV